MCAQRKETVWFEQSMETLIERAKRKEPNAFTELMQSQMQNMYRTARAILMNDEDSADAIQETILVCWEKLKDLKEDKYFRTWMTRILINKCYEIIRENQKISYIQELPEGSIEMDNSNLEWNEAMENLDEKYRLVLILYYGEGFRTDEIARMLKIPSSTVRTRLSRGRKQLAEYYREESAVGKERVI